MRLYPSYLSLHESGELERRIDAAVERLGQCDLCPRACGANRAGGEVGFCKVGRRAIVSSVGPHFGEEPPLVGLDGSGTIFLTYCNLRCVFCQNHDISQSGHGREVSTEELARSMLYLQRLGCHNINFVTPTHVVPQILEALPLAIEGGFTVPLVYNSGGYESVKTLQLLDGIFDIYMPDAKYSDDELATRYSRAPEYFDFNKAALKEMHRQVGVLEVDRQGIARRGLIIRHLVLPQGLAGTKNVMEFIAQELSVDSYVNVMQQYRPEHRAMKYPELSRCITSAEFWEAIDLATQAGLHRFAR